METQLLYNKIFTMRGTRVMVDFHLAEMYAVETKALNQAVKRNIRRFPDDFMFQLTAKEWIALKNRIAMSDVDLNQRSQIVTFDPLDVKQLDRKYLPFAFSELGVAMLSSVLKSERAIDVNISIMRAFVMLRHQLSNYPELSAKISSLEKQMNRKFKDIHEALNYLMNPEKTTGIGFRQSSQNP